MNVRMIILKYSWVTGNDFTWCPFFKNKSFGSTPTQPENTILNVSKREGFFCIFSPNASFCIPKLAKSELELRDNENESLKALTKGKAIYIWEINKIAFRIRNIIGLCEFGTA